MDNSALVLSPNTFEDFTRSACEQCINHIAQLLIGCGSFVWSCQEKKTLKHKTRGPSGMAEQDTPTSGSHRGGGCDKVTRVSGKAWRPFVQQRSLRSNVRRALRRQGTRTTKGPKRCSNTSTKDYIGMFKDPCVLYVRDIYVINRLQTVIRINPMRASSRKKHCLAGRLDKISVLLSVNIGPEYVNTFTRSRHTFRSALTTPAFMTVCILTAFTVTPNSVWIVKVK